MTLEEFQITMADRFGAETVYRIMNGEEGEEE